MKKVLKIIGIIMLVIVILITILLFILSKIPSVPNNYTEKVKTGGNIESKYLAMGQYDVSYNEATALMSFKKYEIYYPTDIKNMEKLPVVVFVNGTGVKGSKYKALQKHMASWGLITIATDEEYAWNGFSAEMSIRYLEWLNEYQEEEKENVFYHKIDLDHVGITGHSQGGIGVINAITDQKHSHIYKSALILSCGDTGFSEAFQWTYDSTQIKIPTMILGSTGKVDSKIASLESLENLYNNIPNEVTKVLARRNDADHGQILYYADGYVTAWFMYYLHNDKEAGKFFIKDNPEIFNNKLYQDQKINLKF